LVVPKTRTSITDVILHVQPKVCWLFVVFPAGILQPPFYHKNNPMWVWILQAW